MANSKRMLALTLPLLFVLFTTCKEEKRAGTSTEGNQSATEEQSTKVDSKKREDRTALSGKEIPDFDFTIRSDHADLVIIGKVVGDEVAYIGQEPEVTISGTKTGRIIDVFAIRVKIQVLEVLKTYSDKIKEGEHVFVDVERLHKVGNKIESQEADNFKKDIYFFKPDRKKILKGELPTLYILRKPTGNYAHHPIVAGLTDKDTENGRLEKVKMGIIQLLKGKEKGKSK